MALTTAEKNRRKRERKKRERELRKQVEEAKKLKENVKVEQEAEEVEIEYVSEPAALAPTGPSAGSDVQETMESVMQRFQERAAVAIVTDDEKARSAEERAPDGFEVDDEEDDGVKQISKRKQRELSRPSVAELKRRVKRPDLVEAHDVTAQDPDLLIYLKAVAGTVPVPRHWGRKRKYLQGKRGIEKPPFQLPDFIVKTGITEIRGSVAEDEAKMSAKQRNRARVAPKMGSIDVDYRTLHDAFFKYQTKPDNLTGFGDLYYEGRELERRSKNKPGAPYSKKLMEALGMQFDHSPPPWLINMQRFGPPPGYPHLKIPGLNAPLPNENCHYGYHSGGWGKPPTDSYGRPLYGGNPFENPGGENDDPFRDGGLVTSDGKTIGKVEWGALPTGEYKDEEEEEDESSEEEESSDEEMESDKEDEEQDETKEDSTPAIPVLQPPKTGLDLRKQAGDETPLNAAPKQLYTVLQQKEANVDDQKGAVFTSDVAYDIGTKNAPEGAESVLSKVQSTNNKSSKKREREDDDEAGDLGKKFKF